MRAAAFVIAFLKIRRVDPLMRVGLHVSFIKFKRGNVNNRDERKFTSKWYERSPVQHFQWPRVAVFGTEEFVVEEAMFVPGGG